MALGFKDESKCIELHADNSSALYVAGTLTCSSRVKHVPCRCEVLLYPRDHKGGARERPRRAGGQGIRGSRDQVTQHTAYPFLVEVIKGSRCKSRAVHKINHIINTGISALSVARRAVLCSSEVTGSKYRRRALLRCS